MNTKLMIWISATALALAGCTTEQSRVSYQSPPPASNYPPQPQQPQQTYDYTPRQEPYPKPVQQSSEAAPQYSQQTPQYDDASQNYAPPQENVPTVDNTQDFEQPLAEQGRWLDTPEYGRVWQPYDQPADWRPYSSDGRWVYTSYGWTWESSQSWGWACYHYGNWVFYPRCGWVWLPGTVWAPAWVVWRECDDYVAWAPCPPPRGPRFFAAFEYCDGVRYHDFVVVERRNFCRPIAPAIVIAPTHNVKIVNKTVNITKIKVVNKTAMNRGPEVTKIEKVTHERVRQQLVRDVVKTPAAVVREHQEEKVRVAQPRDDDRKDKPNRVQLDFEKSTKRQSLATSPTLSNYSAPRDARVVERANVVTQPRTENRDHPAITQSNSPGKSDRKVEKQAQREQQRQPDRSPKEDKQSRKEQVRSREITPQSQDSAPVQRDIDRSDRKEHRRDSRDSSQN